MKNVPSVVVGMIKQPVLKQLKRGWVKAKILYWREERHNHCNNRIVLSFLRDIF